MNKYTVTVTFKDPERPEEVWPGITFWWMPGSQLQLYIDHTEVPGEDRELVAQYTRSDIQTWTRVKEEAEPQPEAQSPA